MMIFINQQSLTALKRIHVKSKFEFHSKSSSDKKGSGSDSGKVKELKKEVPREYYQFQNDLLNIRQENIHLTFSFSNLQSFLRLFSFPRTESDCSTLLLLNELRRKSISSQSFPEYFSCFEQAWSILCSEEAYQQLPIHFTPIQRTVQINRAFQKLIIGVFTLKQQFDGHVNHKEAVQEQTEKSHNPTEDTYSDSKTKKQRKKEKKEKEALEQQNALPPETSSCFFGTRDSFAGPTGQLFFLWHALLNLLTEHIIPLYWSYEDDLYQKMEGKSDTDDLPHPLELLIAHLQSNFTQSTPYDQQYAELYKQVEGYVAALPPLHELESNDNEDITQDLLTHYLQTNAKKSVVYFLDHMENLYPTFSASNNNVKNGNENLLSTTTEWSWMTTKMHQKRLQFKREIVQWLVQQVKKPTNTMIWLGSTSLLHGEAICYQKFRPQHPLLPVSFYDNYPSFTNKIAPIQVLQPIRCKLAFREYVSTLLLDIQRLHFADSETNAIIPTEGAWNQLFNFSGGVEYHLHTLLSQWYPFPMDVHSIIPSPPIGTPTRHRMDLDCTTNIMTSGSSGNTFLLPALPTAYHENTLVRQLFHEWYANLLPLFAQYSVFPYDPDVYHGTASTTTSFARQQWQQTQRQKSASTASLQQVGLDQYDCSIPSERMEMFILRYLREQQHYQSNTFHQIVFSTLFNQDIGYDGSKNVTTDAATMQDWRENKLTKESFEAFAISEEMKQRLYNILAGLCGYHSTGYTTTGKGICYLNDHSRYECLLPAWLFTLHEEIIQVEGYAYLERMIVDLYATGWRPIRQFAPTNPFTTNRNAQDNMNMMDIDNREYYSTVCKLPLAQRIYEYYLLKQAAALRYLDPWFYVMKTDFWGMSRQHPLPVPATAASPTATESSEESKFNRSTAFPSAVVARNTIDCFDFAGCIAYQFASKHALWKLKPAARQVIQSILQDYFPPPTTSSMSGKNGSKEIMAPDDLESNELRLSDEEIFIPEAPNDMKLIEYLSCKRHLQPSVRSALLTHCAKLPLSHFLGGKIFYGMSSLFPGFDVVHVQPHGRKSNSYYLSIIQYKIFPTPSCQFYLNSFASQRSQPSGIHLRSAESTPQPQQHPYDDMHDSMASHSLFFRSHRRGQKKKGMTAASHMNNTLPISTVNMPSYYTKYVAMKKEHPYLRDDHESLYVVIDEHCMESLMQRYQKEQAFQLSYYDLIGWIEECKESLQQFVPMLSSSLSNNFSTSTSTSSYRRRPRIKIKDYMIVTNKGFDEPTLFPWVDENDDGRKKKQFLFPKVLLCDESVGLASRKPLPLQIVSANPLLNQYRMK